MLRTHIMAESAFRRYLPDLQGWVGWFALVRGDELGGVFPTYEAAAQAWMSLYGPVPALIRRIEAVSGRPAARVTPPAPVTAVTPTPPTPIEVPKPGINDGFRMPAPFRWTIPWAAGHAVAAAVRKQYVS